jgi:D-amino-acid oxidase
MQSSRTSQAPSSVTSAQKDDALVEGSHFSALTTPLIAPTDASPHILVVGGGIIGLTTAWALLDRGYQVTVIAKEWPTYTSKQRMTSQIAGALWELPPAVCGQHTDPISLSHSRKWSWASYKLWCAIADDKELSACSGVFVQKSAFFFPQLSKYLLSWFLILILFHVYHF